MFIISHWLDFPVLVVCSMMVPDADWCPMVSRLPDNVEHFVRVGFVVDRPALFVVAPVLVRVARLKSVHNQPVVTFDNQIIVVVFIKNLVTDLTCYSTNKLLRHSVYYSVC